VIVVEHQSRSDCAGWGALISAAAPVAGVRAVIVDGACRDVEEACDIGLPVFPLLARRGDNPVEGRAHG